MISIMSCTRHEPASCHFSSSALVDSQLGRSVRVAGHNARRVKSGVSLHRDFTSARAVQVRCAVQFHQITLVTWKWRQVVVILQKVNE